MNETAFSEDRLLGGRMLLRQPARGHRAGTDAMLLADAALRFPARRAADFGAASGAAGLAFAIRSGTRPHVTIVEIDAALSALGAANLTLNGVSGLALCCDLTAPAAMREAAGLPREGFDLVLMNPPFRDSAASRMSADAARASAHAMPDAALESWLRAAAHHLAPGGHVVLIHRADAAGIVLQALGRGFGGATVRFVHARAGDDALRILLTAQKGSRAPLRILAPLVLHREDGRFTPEAEAIHNGTAARPE
jgi:tRNA1(Val) A37 N6-methylase TrmN6